MRLDKITRLRTLAAVGPFLASTIIPRIALGWGRTGHATVAMIAADRLDSAATARIQQILGPGVTLDQISSCADQIRVSAVQCGSFQLAQDPTSRPWHFINIPITDAPSADALERYCSSGNCVIDAIRNNLKVLQDPQAAQADQQKALMFVVHFVGDEHQPLHCSEEVDPAGKSDLGGNTKPLTAPTNGCQGPSNASSRRSPSPVFPEGMDFAGNGTPQDLMCLPKDLDDDDDAVAVLAASKQPAPSLPSAPSTPPSATRFPLNLHHYWDNLIETDSDEACLNPRSLADQMEQDLAQQDVTSWLQGDFVAGAVLESFSIAKSKIYPAYQKDGGVVGPTYQRTMRPIAYERVEMAGVRLAALLEQALGNNGQAPIAHRPVRRPTTKPAPKPHKLEPVLASF